MPQIRLRAFGPSLCVSLRISLGIAAALVVFDAPAADAGKIKMAFPGPVTTFSLPYIVAQKKGWLGDLEVEDVHVTGDANAMRVLLSGNADIGLRGQPHGLRKAACRRLAEAGCTAPEIAAISGHKSLNEVQRYIEKADRARLARNAVAKTRMATSSV